MGESQECTGGDLNPVPLSWTLACATVACSLAFGSGWQVRAWKAGADRTAELNLQARELARDTLRIDGAAAGYEGKRAAGQQRTRIITREVERVVQTPVYRDRECLDARGLQLVAEAIAGSDTAGGAASVVPSASAAR